MSFRQESLNKLVNVVLWLLEWIGGVDPVEDDVAGALVPQLQGDFLRVDIGALLFVGAASHEDQCLVAFAYEPVVLPSNGRCSIRVFIRLNIYTHTHALIDRSIIKSQISSWN